MHDGMNVPAAHGADATFQGLREEILEDAAEDLERGVGPFGGGCAHPLMHRRALP